MIKQVQAHLAHMPQEVTALGELRARLRTEHEEEALPDVIHPTIRLR